MFLHTRKSHATTGTASFVVDFCRYDVMMTKITDVLKKESEADRQAGWTEVREGCFRSRLALALCRTKSDAGEVVSDVREIFTGVAACLETPRSACTRADIASNVCNLLKFSRIYMAS